MKTVYILLLILLSVVLVSCNKNENEIVVAASPKPHAEILEFAKPLLKEKGYNLVIKRYNDYILPNEALVLKQVDANFFQHVPYLNTYNKENNTNIINLLEVHIEPIGIYSKTYTKISDIKDESTIYMSSSKSDHGRLITLLNNNDLLSIPKEIDTLELTIDDLKENNKAWNPKNLKIDATILPEGLVEAYKHDQADLILINSNFILDANLKISEALILEEAKDNPYANIIATIPEYKDTDKIKALIEVLSSKEVKDFILENWNGDIVVA